ncbi:MAG: FAD-binding oxidoreductase [Cytophagaceae bacterium]|nr:FAD-binding oxidoreductase [Cytophagaceae bacterium]MDW8455231.1 FAD-dependent oxidoreductase [Cytophagaceae bacterium]
MRVDYIIVGRGIAGSLLAYLLHEQGKKILIVSNEKLKSASSVAAGLFNPVTGKRMVLTWKANILFPFLHTFYTTMQKKLHVNFYHSKIIYRPFANIEEQNTWMTQSSDVVWLPFIHTPVDNQFYSEYIRNEYGGFETTLSGYVDLPIMLQSIKKYLSEYCLDADFYSGQLTLYKNYCAWNNVECEKIIFCEGAYAAYTPYFSWLPFVPSKGEVLTARINNFLESRIFNKGVFILPLGKDMYKIGSTYEWSFTDAEPTSAAKEEIIRKAEAFIKPAVEVIHHEAGIRPTVKDRKPFLGLHPEYPCLGIFNGLGTKGVSIAPYYAHVFCDFLLKHKNIPAEVNIQRYYSLYSGSD